MTSLRVLLVSLPVLCVTSCWMSFGATGVHLVVFVIATLCVLGLFVVVAQVTEPEFVIVRKDVQDERKMV